MRDEDRNKPIRILLQYSVIPSSDLFFLISTYFLLLSPLIPHPSALIPPLSVHFPSDALTTFAHFAKSDRIIFANSSGVPPTTSAPWEASRSRSSREPSAAFK